MVDRDGERTSLSRNYERSSELNVDQITNEWASILSPT